MDGYKAKKEREEMVKQEEVKLDAIIKQTLEEDKKYLAAEEKQRFPFRLIVSTSPRTSIRMRSASSSRTLPGTCKLPLPFTPNLKGNHANLLFSVEVTLLPERDPVKRTRTAHVDMDSRKATVHASYEVGGIYGLVAKIKLAVE
jgi:hypothetical protein